ELKWRLLKALFEVQSRYVGFMITDLFGISERFNIPGTKGGENWRVRMPFTVEEMGRRDDLRDEKEKLRNLVRDADR
ncbi:MAG: hypothetical protein GWO24_22730, partial [Akkermansiaceae bacterium]|nr:hypothetical protein [Akkermansiaceae bacterium]